MDAPAHHPEVIAPVVCVKCGLSSPCVDDGKSLAPSPEMRYLLPPGPVLPVVFECTTHGEFFIEDGQQVFYTPDVYVLGPGGRRLFCI